MPARGHNILSLYGPCGRGGVIQVFRNLRSAAGEFGVHLRWIACGAKAMEAAGRYARPEDWECGEVVGPAMDGDKEIAEEYSRQIIERRPTAVLLHVMCGQVETNLAAFLPPNVLRIAFVHTITPSTYRGARAIRDHIHAAIGVSPRIHEDLVRRCGFPADTTFCVPNGLDCSRFSECERPEVINGPLRILSCGRIEDISKGVFWLPDILHKLRASGVNAKLTVAGDGPDRAELERRIGAAGLRDITEFRGWVQREDLPHLYASHDIFLLPSRFEGFALAVVEAMAAGCLPIATRIRGVTDFVVEHGRTGLLFPSGDTGTAARLLSGLARNPKRLTEMQQACRAAAIGRFTVREQARRFAEIVNHVSLHPSKIKAPRPIEDWRILRGLKPTWWVYLPEPLKNALRVLRERIPVV